jgi:hypothetical protein
VASVHAGLLANKCLTYTYITSLPADCGIRPCGFVGSSNGYFRNVCGFINKAQICHRSHRCVVQIARTIHVGLVSPQALSPAPQTSVSSSRRDDISLLYNMDMDIICILDIWLKAMIGSCVLCRQPTPPGPLVSATDTPP